MNDNVLRQVSNINKCLVAHVTLVRPDIVVMTNVIGQLAGLHKPAQITHINICRFKEFKVIQMETTLVTAQSDLCTDLLPQRSHT